MGKNRLLKAERLRIGLDGKIAATHISLIITFNDVLASFQFSPVYYVRTAIKRLFTTIETML